MEKKVERLKMQPTPAEREAAKQSVQTLINALEPVEAIVDNFVSDEAFVIAEVLVPIVRKLQEINAPAVLPVLAELLKININIGIDAYQKIERCFDSEDDLVN